ncbi:hypothetical protein EDD85DRAFT_870633 [Armillaria nabsnona]|nr:hypothetical protein EDD85DRAFT_870633 [Armillaria nabsnona]
MILQLGICTISTNPSLPYMDVVAGVHLSSVGHGCSSEVLRLRTLASYGVSCLRFCLYSFQVACMCLPECRMGILQIDDLSQRQQNYGAATPSSLRTVIYYCCCLLGVLLGLAHYFLQLAFRLHHCGLLPLLMPTCNLHRGLSGAARYLLSFRMYENGVDVRPRFA